MSAAIGTIHKAGIEIIGSFVLGLDGDTQDVFERTAAFAKKHNFVAAQFSILTPFPGTAIFQELKDAGRITDRNWSHYTMSEVAFEPRHMTADELKAGQRAVQRDFYSVQSILKRAFTTRGKLILRLLVNFSYRHIVCGKGLCKGFPKH